MSTSKQASCRPFFPSALDCGYDMGSPFAHEPWLHMVMQYNLEVSRHCDRNATEEGLFQIIALTPKQPRATQRYQSVGPNSCSVELCLSPSEGLISSHNVKMSFRAFCQGSEGLLSVCAKCQITAQEFTVTPSTSTNDLL